MKEDLIDNSGALYPKLAVEDVESPPEIPAEEVPIPRLRPNADMVLIRRLKKDEMTKGGIVLPHSMQDDFFRAEVLAMGRGVPMESGAWISPADCVVGDIVLAQENQMGPRGLHCHLIPVTPDDKQFLLTQGAKIYATELRDDTTSSA